MRSCRDLEGSAVLHREKGDRRIHASLSVAMLGTFGGLCGLAFIKFPAYLKRKISHKGSNCLKIDWIVAKKKKKGKADIEEFCV